MMDYQTHDFHGDKRILLFWNPPDNAYYKMALVSICIFLKERKWFPRKGSIYWQMDEQYMPSAGRSTKDHQMLSNMLRFNSITRDQSI